MLFCQQMQTIDQACTSIIHPLMMVSYMYIDQCHPENNTLESNKVVYIRLLSKYVKCSSYYNSPGCGVANYIYLVGPHLKLAGKLYLQG